MSIFIETVYQGPMQLGEGPHWDADRQQLYFVDIVGRRFHRFNPATGVTTFVNLADSIGFGVPVEGNPRKFIVAQGRNFAILDWDGNSTNPTSVDVVALTDIEYPGNRINDAKCDRRGRLWGGTIVENGEPQNSGSFYRLDLESNLTRQFGGVSVSNGIAWNAAGNVMYYIDTDTRKVDRFDFNEENGTIANRQTLFDLANTSLQGSPDGMTIDAEGNLWVALWGGSKIIQVNGVTGQLLREVTLPTTDITSAAWGGPNLDQLYVTSAGFNNEARRGSVFRLTNTGTRGIEGGSNYRGRIPEK